MLVIRDKLSVQVKSQIGKGDKSSREIVYYSMTLRVRNIEYIVAEGFDFM